MFLRNGVKSSISKMLFVVFKGEYITLNVATIYLSVIHHMQDGVFIYKRVCCAFNRRLAYSVTVKFLP